jgi:GNAT superfamily N-acetyltransferase
MTDWLIIAFEAEHADDVTTLWRESMQAAIGIPPVHDFESQRFFLTHILPEKFEVFVVLKKYTGDVLAFLACNESEISQLYVHQEHQGYGIGHALVEHAKQQSCGTLKLYTFDVNKNARRFYEREGFTGSVGNTENEEGLLDWEYVWTNF